MEKSPSQALLAPVLRLTVQPKSLCFWSLALAMQETAFDASQDGAPRLPRYISYVDLPPVVTTFPFVFDWTGPSHTARHDVVPGASGGLVAGSHDPPAHDTVVVVALTMSDPEGKHDPEGVVFVSHVPAPSDFPMPTRCCRM